LILHSAGFSQGLFGQSRHACIYLGCVCMEQKLNLEIWIKAAIDMHSLKGKHD
jgi:hypothetical protein